MASSGPLKCSGRGEKNRRRKERGCRCAGRPGAIAASSCPGMLGCALRGRDAAGCRLGFVTLVLQRRGELPLPRNLKVGSSLQVQPVTQGITQSLALTGRWFKANPKHVLKLLRVPLGVLGAEAGGQGTALPIPAALPSSSQHFGDQLRQLNVTVTVPLCRGHGQQGPCTTKLASGSSANAERRDAIRRGFLERQCFY